MISIRDSVSEEVIGETLKAHTDFLVDEINKKIKNFKKINEGDNKVIEQLKLLQIFLEDIIKLDFVKEKDNKKNPEEKKEELKKIIKDYNKKHDTNHNIEDLDSYFQNALKLINEDKEKNKDDALNNKIDIIDIYDKLFYGIKEILPKIINYNWFVGLKPYRDWGTYQLIEKIDLKTCCYCNQNYTFSIKTRDGAKIMRPDLDHFLPKKEHPIFALSFYNLIPCCKICNQSLKKDNDFSYEKYISPYDDEGLFKYLYFDYDPKNYASAVGNDTDLDITINIKSDDNNNGDISKKLNKHIEVFKYNEIYSVHKDTVREIIKKRFISNDKYIETLIKTFPEAKLSKREAYQLAYGNYSEVKDFCKRPFSKLTKDIAISVGIK